jgi:hypothetical protein
MWRSTILAGLLCALLGCQADTPVIEVRVTSINGGGPVLADLRHFDEGTGLITIPEDVAVVEFTNRNETGSVVTDPGTFVNAFQLESYTVRWRRADGGPTSGTGWTLADYNFDAATSFVVPANSTAETGILIAPAGMKTEGPFAEALANGQELLLIADIEFIGRVAVGPTEDMHVYGSVSVNFADFADK